MPKTRVYAPADVVPDIVVPITIPKGCTFFEFHNESRYHILLRNDAGAPSPSKVFDPVDVVLPYSSTSVQIEPEDVLISYVAAGPATGGYRIAAPLPEDENSFWFVVSDYPRTAPAFRGVGIQGRLINITRDTTEPFISAKLEGDLFNRLELYADASFFIGQGDVSPQQLWDSPAPGTIEFLNPPQLLPGAPPAFSDWQFVTANWVASQIAGGLFSNLQADNLRGSGAAPSVYPLGWSAFRRTDGAGTWPDSSTGIIITERLSGGDYSTQRFIDKTSNIVYTRLGIAGDTWAGFHAVPDAGDVKSVTSVALTPGLNWTEVMNLVLRKSYNGAVQIEGRLENNSGSAKAAGSRITTIPAAHRPVGSGNKFWACVRFPSATPNTAGFEQIMPVWYDSTDGTVNLGDSLASGARVDVSPLAWISS